MAFSLGKVRMVDAMARFPAPIAVRESRPKRSCIDDWLSVSVYIPP